MKKIYTIILVATLGFFFAGCDHYLDVNKNVDAPSEDMVEDFHYLAGIESALQGLTWGYTRALTDVWYFFLYRILQQLLDSFRCRWRNVEGYLLAPG